MTDDDLPPGGPDDVPTGQSDSDVNFPSSAGSDLTSGHESGDAVTGQRPIPRDERTTGESTVGQPVSDSADTTAR